MTAVNYTRPWVLVEASSLVGHSSSRYVKYSTTPQSTRITSNVLCAHVSAYSTRSHTWPSSRGTTPHSLPLVGYLWHFENILHRISHHSSITFGHSTPTSSTPANLLVIQTPIIHSRRLHMRYITLYAHWTSPRVNTPFPICTLPPPRNMSGIHERKLSVYTRLPHSLNQAPLACANTVTSLSMFSHNHLQRPIQHAPGLFPIPTHRILVLFVSFTPWSTRTSSHNDGMIYKHHS